MNKPKIRAKMLRPKAPAHLYKDAKQKLVAKARSAVSQNNTVIAGSQDGTVVEAAYDAPNKTTWLTVRSYQNRDGNGSFLTFQNMDSNGKWYDALGFNGGFIINKAGKVSSCLDILGYSEGKQFSLSINGAANGYPAALVSDPREVPIDIGSSFNGFNSLWLKEYPRRPGMPTGVKRCVKVNGGYIPIYE